MDVEADYCRGEKKKEHKSIKRPQSVKINIVQDNQVHN